MLSSETAPKSTEVASRTRYKVLGLTVALAGVTYLDRVCISITAPYIATDLGLSQKQMGWVFSAFTLAYGLFEIPTGAWGDRIGTRKVLTRIVLWWSAFTMLTAASFNYLFLLVVRFLFGIGEAGAWPNSARTLSRWFPSNERATAQGVFFMGAHLAGGLTPILVTQMMLYMNWRMVFIVFGFVGVAWSIVWYSWFRDEPAQHASANAAECTLIEDGRPPDTGHGLSGIPWRAILGNRSVLALCGMYLTQTYGFYFYITWFPTYLRQERGLTAGTLGLVAGLPLLLSVVADFTGGLCTDWATRKLGRRKGRALVGGGSFLLAALFMFIGTQIEDAIYSAIFIAIAAAWTAFLLGAAWSTAVDVGGSRAGVVTAFMNTAGQVGGFLSPVVLAYLVHGARDWSVPLYTTGVLYLFGALCWCFIDPDERVIAPSDHQG
jgi:ACS family glucarate transporter-like MFS transporter